jgi:O-antigen/teichoic acid export membrane protein
MFASHGIRLFIQAGYFIIIARSLGPQQYGAFVAVTAFASILAPIVGLGGGDLLIRNTARDKGTFSESWGNLLLVTVVSGTLLTAVVAGLARIVLPPSIPTVVMIAVVLADLVFWKLIDCAAFGFQALERLDLTALVNITSSVTRLVGIAVLALAFHHPTSLQWSVVYLLATILSAAIGVGLIRFWAGSPRLIPSRIRAELKDGLYFASALSAHTVYNDIDKSMLARMATLDAAGIYAAAYRLVEVAFVPVRSILSATYPGFFRAGEEGLSATVTRMRRIVRLPVAYAVVVFMASLALAPVIPHVLGKDYANSVEALRWLSILPLLKTVHYFLSDSLTGAGYQRLRMLVQVLVAFFNIAINLWLIPAYSWRGAAWSSIASDGLLALLMWIVIVRLQARNTPHACRVSLISVAARR